MHAPQCRLVLIGPPPCICRQWSIAAATRAALGSCWDRPSSAPASRRARWWRTAPSVTPRSRAMWLLVAPRAAKVLMVMRASGSSRLILASAPRNGAVRGPQPEATARKSGCRLTRNLPRRLTLVDSTGLKLCGPGEWLIEKHGTRRRRAWRKMHIGVDADTGRIVASSLTTHDADDGAQVGPLLDQVAAPLASFTGDGAYDQDGVYASVAERHPGARVIVPPRSTAVPSAAVETAPTQRDQHLQLIAEHGRMGWQKASGYNHRALAEATIGRFKRVIGGGLRSRTDQRQATEMTVAVAALNRMLKLGRPKSVRIA